MRYALLSVWNKEHLEGYARELASLGYRIVATGGTYSYLKRKGLDVLNVSEITSFPEILGGRVKTLNPIIFGAILYRRGIQDDEAMKFNLPKIDMLVVDLYPFESNTHLNEDEILELMDIGGVALLRAGAKNYKDVIVVSSLDDLGWIVDHLRKHGDLTLEQRRELFLKAMYRVSSYDAFIYNHFLERWNRNALDYPWIRAYERFMELRYGENPNQRGVLYRNTMHEGFSRNFKLIHGKPLSFNNVLDIACAYETVMEFDAKAVCIVKHGIPCGVAESDDGISSYELALESDRTSAYGSIVAFNFKVDEELAYKLKDFFHEILVAPEFSEKALAILSSKKSRRLVVHRKKLEASFRTEEVFNDLIVSERQGNLYDRLEVVSGNAPSKQELEDVLFGLKVAKHVKSNAIVLVKNRSTVGIGGCETSRIGALEIALRKAGSRASGSIMVSDGFLPFPDSVELAYRHGIKLIVQPGGSIRDDEVIATAKKLGIGMVLTGVRLFSH